MSPTAHKTLAVLAVCFAAASWAPDVSADDTIKLPSGCDRGDLLVYEGSSFACKAPNEVLKVDSCDDGEFLVSKYGRLECKGASSGSWGNKGLLPQCSSGQWLESEGWGSWKCIDKPE